MSELKYREIKTSKSFLGKCPECGRYVQRRKTFTATVNPYNRNADGEPKTVEEVRADVQAEASKWSPDFTHEKCGQERAVDDDD